MIYASYPAQDLRHHPTRLPGLPPFVKASFSLSASLFRPSAICCFSFARLCIAHSPSHMAQVATADMLFRSPFPEFEVPAQDLPTFFFDYTKRQSVYGKNPKLVAILDKTQSLSFAELESTTVSFASGLVNNVGFKQGDILATVLPNTSFYPIVTMGTLMAGGIVTTANPAYNARELAHQLKLTEAKVVVTLQEAVPVVKEALRIANVPIPGERILTIDGENNVRGVFSSAPFPRVYLTTDAEVTNTPSFIVFSSGTSGTPKGVVLSHRNLVSNAMQFLCAEHDDADLMAATKTKHQRRWLHVLPMFHIYGILISHISLMSGGVVVVMEKFVFEEFCALIMEHKIDTLYLAPPVILGLVKNPIADKYDLSSIVFINSGAAPLTKELQVEAEKKLGAFVTQGYGLSETSPGVARAKAKDKVPGSIGRLLPNTVAAIVDDDGNRVGANEIGEMWVKGPQVMIEYYKNPQATAETVDGDGYLHTGDIGYIDSDNNLFITDRKKELIKYKGFQIAPAELEGLLTDHPAVVDAAVIPVFDESRASELPKAYVVVRPEMKRPGICDDISKWLESRVVDYKKLRGGVELIDAIPKSATGKILRRVLKELEASRHKQSAKL
ncbi:acetyl-CoA synthetase-like protein [Martensiomyces pterosporus]|nr:acetyl-CoA synthetase-like protein [Martensiomyces pterosporus]